MDATLEALRSGALDGSRELKLGGGLTDFPREIFDLEDTLEVLDLSGNALNALPDDLGRLKKLRILFCSGNRFERMPPVLSDCRTLSQVGFRGAGLKELPTESLPPRLRWLTLTDNRLQKLPSNIGELPYLQKLMLAGNQLCTLPKSLAGAENLELLRLSANAFEGLPTWLTELPRLAWLAWAGNPLDFVTAAPQTKVVHWSELQIVRSLGEGASGDIYEVRWLPNTGRDGASAALKLFKGTMTSDGLPEREMQACLLAGEHPNLIGTIGALVGHPSNTAGLLMPLAAADWAPLAGPPSPESCSRDIYNPGLKLSLEVALHIAAGVGRAASHLHDRGLIHGDLYAHNTLWDGTRGAAVLGDFGAASFLSEGIDLKLKQVDVLAWGILFGELLDVVSEPANLIKHRRLQQNSVCPSLNQRPAFADILDELAALT